MKAKRVKENVKLVDKTKRYSIDEAIDIMKATKKVKFDETVEIGMSLGVDPKKSDQMVRGAVTLPNGTGKTVKILVFANGDKAKEAQDAGADFVGEDDIIEKIAAGFTSFDLAIATPDLMKKVGKLGKILGVRGLMPNPKVGTVTNDIKKVVEEAKKGRIQFKLDKGANIHTIVGKISFEKDKLKENILFLLTEVKRARPQSAKGTYFKSVTLSTTMGVGVPLNTSEINSLK
ncbi:TPA: 50S ribosomal protein L1 [candidate division WOR-3 bacterium]|jgi:large subunit ribosomal protein L1|uniref:Large ribosomal subunit protein uL1 n=1 Tax=candidate division WOR-3 bacterium TaxID=2052148 RepID=A0A350HCC0_UNCW3|nr:50S ribosomal protein L1 [candidate division WOR-3 bacterium]